jgi:hypothetical protein
MAAPSLPLHPCLSYAPATGLATKSLCIPFLQECTQLSLGFQVLVGDLTL